MQHNFQNQLFLEWLMLDLDLQYLDHVQLLRTARGSAFAT